MCLISEVSAFSDLNLGFHCAIIALSTPELLATMTALW
jgi:hypothetical protein